MKTKKTKIKYEKEFDINTATEEPQKVELFIYDDQKFLVMMKDTDTDKISKVMTQIKIMAIL